MQSQDCWYWMPVAVAVTHCSVSDSRCTAWWGKVGVKQEEGSELGQVTGAEASEHIHGQIWQKFPEEYGNMFNSHGIWF